LKLLVQFNQQRPNDDDCETTSLSQHQSTVISSLSKLTRGNMTSIKDRTNEFFATVDSMLQRGSAAPYSLGGAAAGQERSRLLGNVPTPTSKSEFTKAASAIGKEINSTVLKLQKLTVLAKKKSLFDDRPVEINELIYVIKQDIAKVNNQISALARYHAQAKANASGGGGGLLGGGGSSTSSSSSSGLIRNKQVDEHSTNVITSLQSRLASTSNEFKTILEIRTQNMKDQKSRRDQYSFTGAAAAGSASPPGMGRTGSNAASNTGSSTEHSLAGGVVAGKTATPPPPSSLALSGSTPGLPPPGSLFSVGTPTAPGSGSPSSSSLFTPATSFQSPLYNPERKPGPSGNLPYESQLRNRGATAGAGDVVLDLGGAGGAGGGINSQQQQMMFVGGQAANMEYIESRAQAIESIESTIAELGQIYQHFAQILAGQREMVQRIDDNVMDVEMNVTGAHDQLLKYFQNMSTNRWLMIKVFAVLVFFFLLFVLIT
jgi:syntaxin 5